MNNFAFRPRFPNLAVQLPTFCCSPLLQGLSNMFSTVQTRMPYIYRYSIAHVYEG